MGEGVNEETKHAIDQLIKAWTYIHTTCHTDKGANDIWDGYLTLVHALYTPEDIYRIEVPLTPAPTNPVDETEASGI